MTNDSFQHQYADLPGVRIHYVTYGSGYPVLLIHGWPQTWFEWRLLMPLLGNRYRLIAPDLRGLGDSSRPASGYDKKTVAADLWRLMREVLGYPGFAVVGHDWGSAVAARLAMDHADAVSHLALLDVPVLGDRPPQEGGRLGDRWHHQFHNVPDLPEALTVGRERVYLEFFLKNGCDVAGVFPEEVIDTYVRAYAQPGAMRAGFNLYRALNQDVQDNRAVFEAGFKLTMPTLGLGGGGRRGRGEIVLRSLQRVATDVRGGAVPNCGHFIPEEAPDFLARALIDLIGDGGGVSRRRSGANKRSAKSVTKKSANRR